MKFLNTVDFNNNEIQKVKLQKLGAPPTGADALIYYDTAIKKLGVYANGAWTYPLITSEKGASLGVASLSSGSLVNENPLSAQVNSGGATGKIPLSTTGGLIDLSYLPTLNNIPLPTASLNMNTLYKIINLAEPTLPQDAATKNYVDNAVQGLDTKLSVRVATTANIALSGTQTIDTIAVIVGDRVLVKNQTLLKENGIYVVAAGAWARALDADSWNELVSGFVFVEGSLTAASADTGWVCTVDPGGNLGTTDVTWAQFSAAGQVGGTSLGTGTGTIFKGKVSNNLTFASIKAVSNKISVSNNADLLTVDLDVDESKLVFANMTLSGTLAVGKGGTGTTSMPTNNILIGAGTQIGALAPHATVGMPLVSQGSSSSPLFAALPLDTAGTISGVLPTANGGTGSAWFGITGPTALRSYAFPNVSCTILTSNAAVTVAQGGTGLTSIPAYSIMTGAGTGNVAVVPTSSNTGAPLLSGGSAAYPNYGALNLAGGATIVSGILPAANGGTNNAFTQFTGATTSVKSYALPNASCTILTDNAVVSVAQGGTGVGSMPAYHNLIGMGTQVGAVAPHATVGMPFVSTGSSSAPAYQALPLATAGIVSGILPSANGGTGNGFTKFAGASAAEKTFTLPNASATILTDNAAVTVAQGGTGGGTVALAKTNLGYTTKSFYAIPGNNVLLSFTVTFASCTPALVTTQDVIIMVYEKVSTTLVQVFPDIVINDATSATVSFNVAPVDANQYRVVLVG